MYKEMTSALVLYTKSLRKDRKKMTQSQKLVSSPSFSTSFLRATQRQVGLFSLVIVSIFAALGYFSVYTQAGVPKLKSSIETEFATYQPYIVDVTPKVKPYTIEPDLANVINADKFTFSDEHKAMLIQNGFVAVPSNFKQVYDVYNYCKDMGIPIFVTTDAVLHTYHILFDYTLRVLEMQQLFDDATTLTEAMFHESMGQLANAQSERAKSATKKNVAYFSVAAKLLDENFVLPEEVADVVRAELDLIEQHAGFAPSPIFNSPLCKYWEDYSQYVPRGHYTRNDTLKKYFRAMMWYGRMMFRLKPCEEYGGVEKGKEETLQALLIVAALAKAKAQGAPLLEIWDRIYQPTVFFVGKTDDLNVYEYIQLMEVIYGEDYVWLAPDDFDKDNKLVEFITAAKELRDPAIVSTLMFPFESMEVVKGFKFMGQRFIPDSYMFQQLVFPKVTGRLFPKGLDIFAVLGSSRAYDILINRYDEDGYLSYVEQIEKLKDEFEILDDAAWAQNLYWNWLYVFQALLSEKREGYPYFMQNIAWTDKELATTLGSWAELRHDTILYAKPSYTLPTAAISLPPEAQGYVEPNAELYARLASLAKFTKDGLSNRGLMLDEFSRKLEALEALLLSLKEISEAELQNQPLTEEQYNIILYIGEKLEDITTFPGVSNMYYQEIESDADKEMPVIADVHTDPNSGEVLEEGVGYPMNIYAVVPVEGKLKIAQGAMFSYYEFTHPLSDRLTDEIWQHMLKNNPKDLPIWFDSFMDLPKEPLKKFTLSLHKGINLISIPLRINNWRFSDLARHIDDLTTIIRYDWSLKKFVSYLPSFPDESKANASLECGEGYIVIMKVDKTVAFEGYPCVDTNAAASSPFPLLLSNDGQSTSIFAVIGNVRQEKAVENINEVTVQVRNLRTGQMLRDITGTLAGDGNYVVTFISQKEKFMTRAKDGLEIKVQDKEYQLKMTPIIHTLSNDEISQWVLSLPLRLGPPKESALFQNYPNPFNPDTWIPYQLREPADVVISIYNLRGQLVRRLNLGHRAPGFYLGRTQAAYWDGKNEAGEKVASGVYFYQLFADDFGATRKMVIVK